MWHSFGDVEAYNAKAEILAGHCAAVGRDPSEIEHTWGVMNNLMDQVDDLHAAGVSHFILGVGGAPGGYDLTTLRELVAWRERQNGTAS